MIEVSETKVILTGDDAVDYAARRFPEVCTRFSQRMAACASRIKDAVFKKNGEEVIEAELLKMAEIIEAFGSDAKTIRTFFKARKKVEAAIERGV